MRSGCARGGCVRGWRARGGRARTAHVIREDRVDTRAVAREQPVDALDLVRLEVAVEPVLRAELLRTELHDRLHSGRRDELVRPRAWQR
eukprot:6015868-Prymnesium_polylepis.1